MAVIACIALIALVVFFCARDTAEIRDKLSKAGRMQEQARRLRRQDEQARGIASPAEKPRTPGTASASGWKPPGKYEPPLVPPDSDDEWIDLSDEYTPRQAEMLGFLDGHVRVRNPKYRGKDD